MVKIESAQKYRDAKNQSEQSAEKRGEKKLFCAKAERMEHIADAVGFPSCHVQMHLHYTHLKDLPDQQDQKLRNAENHKLRGGGVISQGHGKGGFDYC